MHGGAVQGHAGGQRRLVRAHALETGQQRGMDVQHPALETRHEAGREDPHEAGQHHQVGRETLDLGGQRGVEGLAAVVLAMVDDGRRDPALGRERQTGRIGPVRDHGGHAGRPGVARARVDDGLHVAAAA